MLGHHCEMTQVAKCSGGPPNQQENVGPTKIHLHDNVFLPGRSDSANAHFVHMCA